jgi:hypothetical protein
MASDLSKAFVMPEMDDNVERIISISLSMESLQYSMSAWNRIGNQARNKEAA